MKRQNKALKRYQVRMQRVLDYIDGHLDEDLGLAVLSGVAAFSKYHFHRQFKAVFGLSVHDYVHLSRMKRASYQLAFRGQTSLMDVALDAGFESPDAFGRAFRKRFGQSPGTFRRTANSEGWLANFDGLSNTKQKVLPAFKLADVRIFDIATVPVAMAMHLGDPSRIGYTIRRFIAWRKTAGSQVDGAAIYNIFHSEAHPNQAEDFRLDIAVKCNHPIAANDGGVVPGFIDGGPCAMLPVVGAGDDLEPAATFLYHEWLPQSGREPRGFPLFCRRTRLFPDVTENQAVVELYLPLK